MPSKSAGVILGSLGGQKITHELRLFANGKIRQSAGFVVSSPRLLTPFLQLDFNDISNANPGYFAKIYCHE